MISYEIHKCFREMRDAKISLAAAIQNLFTAYDRQGAVSQEFLELWSMVADKKDALEHQTEALHTAINISSNDQVTVGRRR